MNNITFANPEYFYLLILIPVILTWYLLRQKKRIATLRVPSSEGFAGARPSIRQRLRHLPLVLRLLAIALLVVALARPQSSATEKSVETEGIDIALSLDISGSMLAEDFKPNRLGAAKETATEFIKGRPNDRIGLVVFAGESFTQCPLTTDHDVLINLLESIKTGMIEDGTAIGMGLATGVNRLQDSKAKSKVIILLTDGVNNTGTIAPQTAAEIAETFGIRVYTIGVGSRGTAPYPFRTPYGIKYKNVEVKIDEDMLKKIASKTGGQYFRATNNQALKEIYQEIDKLEKTKIDVSYFTRHSEEFLPFALAAAILIFLELLFRYTWLRNLP
ncbi:MAG: vWA domain-containing protein [Candidatus Kapaibacterium sp.]